MSTLRVLHVLEATGYGTGRHLIDLVANTSGIAHHVAMPRHRNKKGEPVDTTTFTDLTALGVVVHELPMRPSPVHPRNAEAILRLRRLLDDLHPDIVHGHSSIGGLVARVAGAGTDVPVLYTPHGLHPNDKVMRVEKRLAGLTERFVAVSDSEANRAITLGLFAPDDVIVIPNGIDPTMPGPPTADLRARFSLPDDRVVIGWVGRLARQKAPDVFLRAVSRAALEVPKLHTVMLGTGPDRAMIDRLVEEDPFLSGRVHRLNHLPAAATVMGQFDLVCLPSRWEGGPYTALEAMRASLPLVVSDAVGCRDAVVDGVTGRIVPVDDEERLAEALVEIATDANLRRRLGAAGHDRLREVFTAEAMGRRTQELYEGLATDRSRT